MNSSTKTRYKTGEKCPAKGNYKFDGYVDGTRTPSPTAEEKRIPLETGETFPPFAPARRLVSGFVTSSSVSL